MSWYLREVSLLQGFFVPLFVLYEHISFLSRQFYPCLLDPLGGLVPDNRYPNVLLLENCPPNDHLHDDDVVEMAMVLLFILVFPIHLRMRWFRDEEPHACILLSQGCNQGF